MPRAAARNYLSIELRRDALVQRLADDIYPAFRAELGQDARDVGLHGPAGQEHAAGDVRGRVASGDEGGDLQLGRGQRVPARDGSLPSRAPCAPPDAVRAEPGVGPPDVPARLKPVI